MGARRLRNFVLVAAIIGACVPLNLLGVLRPISALAYTWDASVDTTHVPAIWYTDTSPSFDVKLTNTGTATWPTNSPDGHSVQLAAYFTNENRDTCTCRFPLPNDVAPGGSVTIHVQRPTPFDVGSYTLDINLVKLSEFWFDAQTPNLPVAVPVQVKLVCGAYCNTVLNSAPSHYWRLNDPRNGAGPYRDGTGTFMTEYPNSSVAGNVTDRRIPADGDPSAASIHVSGPFGLGNPTIIATIPNQPQNVTALGGWVKQDSDQAGHVGCFLEGSPTNGDAYLCRDAAGNLSFQLTALCPGNNYRAFTATAGNLLDDGGWHYVLGRYQNGANAESELWVDGAMVGFAAQPSAAPCTGTDPLVPIREVYFGDGFHGFFSEVAYWQTIVPLSSVGPLANAPVGGPVTTAQALGGGTNHCVACSGLSHGNVTPSPIDTSNGNFWHTFSDVSIPGRSYPLAFVRTYNSQ